MPFSYYPACLSLPTASDEGYFEKSVRGEFILECRIVDLKRKFVCVIPLFPLSWKGRIVNPEKAYF